MFSSLILRPSCAYISLLRIVFPTVRISGLPCTAERLPLGGQAFSPGGATILPRSDSIPQLYHKSISPCRRFPSPLRDCTTTRLLLALLSASHYIKSSRAQSSTAVSLRPRQELSGVAKGGAAQDGAKEAHLLEAEEAPRGVERRAERHAATRFVGCAAEHAARLGGCIQPTKHRDAKRREGDGSGDEGRGSEAETGRRRDEHPRCHGRQVSPPSAEHTEASRGGLRRTATLRRICIRRAVAWTRRPSEWHRAHGCGETCRALTGKDRCATLSKLNRENPRLG